MHNTSDINERNHHVYVAEAPSNIAFLKYWGKRDAAKQWPANDSLSMTLAKARTITKASLLEHGAVPSSGSDVVIWKGETLPVDHPAARRVTNHLTRLRSILCQGAPLQIDTTNTFPAACGIASSASGFAALTIAALGAWTGANSLQELDQIGFSRRQMALLARLGSGSACRSLWGGYVRWCAGNSADEQDTLQKFPESHWRLADTIVIVSAEEKKVSSRIGHESAFTSPLMGPRLGVLPERMTAMESALATRNMEALGTLIETEALEMHAVMMSSTPAAHYLLRETTELLSWVRKRRYFGDFPAWFTLDAGPNIHLICETQHREAVVRALREDWPQYQLIEDETGSGPNLQLQARATNRNGGVDHE